MASSKVCSIGEQAPLIPATSRELYSTTGTQAVHTPTSGTRNPTQVKQAISIATTRELEESVNGSKYVTAKDHIVYAEEYVDEDGVRHRTLIRWDMYLQERLSNNYNDEFTLLIKEDSRCQDCVSCCCEAYTCCSPNSCEFQKHIEFSPYLERARRFGVNIIYNDIIKHLLPPIIRFLIVYIGFIVTCMSFGFSLYTMITFLNSERQQLDKTFAITTFAFSLLGIVFTTIDVILYFRRTGCRPVQRLCNYCCRRRSPSYSELNINDGANREQPEDGEPAFCKNACECGGNECGRGFVAIMDIIRIIVLETVFYPKLLISIFQFITLLVRDDFELNMITWTQWFSESTTFAGVLFLVYIHRIGTFAYTVHTTKKDTVKENRSKILKFMIFFVLHMYSLMALQVMMIVIIGVRFHHDYTSPERKFSGQLWYMMVTAYLTPIFGMIMFFIVYHYWVITFPIHLVAPLFQAKGEKPVTNAQYFQNIHRYLGDNLRLSYDYDDEISRPLSDKLLYPFFSPLHAILCCVYTSMLLGFVVCTDIQGPHPFHWLVAVYVITGLLGALVDIYAALVLGFWIITLLVLLVLWIISILMRLLALLLMSFLMYLFHRPICCPCNQNLYT